MTKFITKLYLYDSSQEANGYRGLDFSANIQQGDSDTDDLTEILDVVDITLFGLNFSEEFAPKTKFIYEKWEEGDDGTLAMWKDWHLSVAEDIVSQPIMSDDGYFDHHITFNEASVDAQGRIVDNIAVTYRLQDVSIDSVPTYSQTAIARSNIQNVIWTPINDFDTGGVPPFSYATRYGRQYRWIMPTWYQVNDINGNPYTPNWDVWNNFLLNQEITIQQGQRVVSLPLPMLQTWASVPTTRTFSFQGYCSLAVTVEEYEIATGIRRKKNMVSNGLETPIVYDNLQVNPADSNPVETVWNTITADAGFSNPPKGVIHNRSEFFLTGTRNVLAKRLAQYDSIIQNRTIDFIIRPACQYSISIRLFNFTGTSIPGWGSGQGQRVDATNPPSWSYSGSISGFLFYSVTNNPQFTNNGYPTATLNFNAVLAGESLNLFLRQAPPANAYELYKKAQITTQNNIKQLGVPIDETPQAYFVSPQDRQQLENTQIVENFYSQKNWWEIQIDIGKYIHSIPKCRFGSDDRYITTWRKLGVPTQYADVANKINIFNSRNIEEYVSAVSSYVTNMVQLGGIIDVWVAPKSSSDDFLVYNDVAEIITPTNIIEIVDMEVKNVGNPNIPVGATRNLAGKGTQGEDTNGFVFEENVYQILSINANDSVNKGRAIFYTLGDNRIRGLNYRLPTINTGDLDNEYAMKRIIGIVFNLDPSVWAAIKINDFVFHIVYRTKDTLRSNQTRPDLRKYLLTSKHDQVPQHNQFSNQQDVVVDSVKYGNKVYGQLIRTGNTTFSKIEWVESLFQLKQSGELYNIRGNIYYVSKVKNTYFGDHIISEVEFSKDFNRLSQIIGIPSEPRFYEISEQSLIKREVPLDDYIVVGTSVKSTNNPYSFIRKAGWNYIAQLMLDTQTTFPKFAVTVLKNDQEKATITGNETFYNETCHPLGTYSLQNTLTFSWGMLDNFSAGDQVFETALSIDPSNATNTAYNTLVPFRYPDVFGRVDMLDFAIVYDFDMTPSQIKLLPANPIDIPSNEPVYLFGNETITNYGDNLHGLGLMKDNREALHFNYNLQALTDSDRFVLSAYLWQPNKENLKLALLNEEVNKISNETIPLRVIADLYDYTYSVDSDNGVITINISTALQGVDLTGVSALALISTDDVGNAANSEARYFIIARNITGLSAQDMSADWIISNYDKSMFPQQ